MISAFSANLFAVIFFCGLLAGSSFAQVLENPLVVKGRPPLETSLKVTRPDFSGRWQLNRDKSIDDDGKKPDGFAGFPWHFLIEQKDPVFSVIISSPYDPSPTKESSAAAFTWHTDGRGNEWNYTFEDPDCTTIWAGRKLVTTHYDSYKPKNVTQIEEIELGADGKTILLTLTFYLYLSRETGKVGYKGVAHFVFDRVNGPLPMPPEPELPPKPPHKNSRPGAITK